MPDSLHQHAKVRIPAAEGGPWRAVGNRAIDVDLIPKRPIGPLQLVLLLCLAVGSMALLAAILFHGTEGIDLEIFLALVLLYAAASTVFVISQVRHHYFPLF